MDILSLSRWRCSCRDAYAHGSASLRRSLTHRLRGFVGNPHGLLELVTRHGAIFGGELALSFLLRDEPFRPSSLEIFAGSSEYNKLCDALLDDLMIRTCIDKHSFIVSTLFHATRRLIAESLIIHLNNGMVIYVHRSYTTSPSAPITRSCCTALSNFVTGYGFGCSHPELTLARRALLADGEIPYLSSHDAQSLNRLFAYNFSMAVSPTAWPEYRRDVDDGTLRSAEECWRERYLCPNQGRYFGDKGSLVGFLDPLGEDVTRCMEANLAPFGPMVIWRLLSTFECDDGCEFLDPVLEPGVTSIPVFFRKDPFGELRDCFLDRGSLYPCFHRLWGRTSSPFA